MEKYSALRRCAHRGGLRKNGARKQYIVFQMDVLVQVLLKLLQAFIEGVVGRARAHGRGETAGQALNIGQKHPSGIVLTGHHTNGVGYPRSGIGLKSQRPRCAFCDRLNQHGCACAGS